ncbi:hydrolase [Bradyrhizobium guangzhouense]|uniref:Hydrolase n=1 Tax=Bradyrhizobium guangzhouense TaxID=1325095 RepID=A0AAE5WW33_9BRAD|nr:hydrolase [Bradyrhizobium guangzhouense]QAU44209.1 hydrolase [Bradyrhizobium guangzhouense]RXH11548.1 hydrolase [Bradyrhizobium guangzhouense]
MRLSRRTILQGAASLPFAVASLRMEALAQTASAASSSEVPPILFVHGNGDYDALWITTLWRMESNGIARDRMMAINFTNPSARTDDAVEQASRSSTEDQRRELAAAIAELKRRTGAARVALVGNSRGGNSIRNVIKNGGVGDVSHAVLCGTPNHGVFALDALLGSEFNGRGAFLRGLNAGDSEVTPGVAFLTLRSDGMDKYAQPDGRFMGKPGVPTNVTAEGPELKGATNLVLGAIDHRETAYHPRAFREIYKFIAGREPARIAITPERTVRISGLVTGTADGVPTNRPVAGATVEIYHVDRESGERKGELTYRLTTAADGRWGPAEVDPASPLEIVLTSPDAPTTHFYRSPFPRSSNVVHLRAARPFLPAEKDAGAVVIMSRPRGYFGLPRDTVLLDGREPTDVTPGVPTDATATLRLPASEVGRSVVAEFNEERIVARAWPASENRIAVAELTY